MCVRNSDACHKVVSAKLDAISTDFDEAVEDLGAIATRMEASEVCAAAIANQVGGKFDSTCPEYTGTAPAQCEELEAPEGGKVTHTHRGCFFFFLSFFLFHLPFFFNFMG